MSKREANGERRYLVPGLVRGIRILQLFGRDREAVAASEIGEELGIPRATVFRLTRTLEHLGMIEKVKHGQAFRLGIGVLGLGFEYLSGLGPVELGRPIVDAIAEATGLSSHLVLRDGTQVVVVHKAEGKSAFSGTLTVGSRLPAHATVLGRMTLLDLPRNELDALNPDPAQPAFSEQTPRTVAELAALLAADRARGYAISDSFFENGISAVAAPVRDQDGRSICALNATILGAASAFTRLDDVVAAVCAGAERLSAALNYAPATAAHEVEHAG